MSDAYAGEKAPWTRGWTYTGFEEAWSYGFPQEMAHFVECIRTRRPSIASVESGVRVVEILEAAQRSLVLDGTPVELGQRDST